MKKFVFVITAMCTVHFALLSMAIPIGTYADDGADQISRIVVHKDGTYTTTSRDKDTRILIRKTKKRNNTLIMRSEFALDEFGRERKGRVYDGQNNLLFISEFVYDGNELLEERVFNSRGKIVRRLLYQVKVVSKLDGRLRPALVSYQNGRPIGDLVALDDPQVFSTTSTHPHASNKDEDKSAGLVLRTKDGSAVRLRDGAVQYPGVRSRELQKGRTEEAPKPKRKLRIFKRRN